VVQKSRTSDRSLARMLPLGARRPGGLQNLSAHPKDLSEHRRGPRKSCLSRARVLAPQPRPEPEILGERNFVVSSFASRASGLVGRFGIIYRRASRKPEAENAPLVDQLAISSLTAALNVKWQ